MVKKQNYSMTIFCGATMTCQNYCGTIMELRLNEFTDLARIFDS